MTDNDWMTAINAYFDPGPEPSQDDGWFTITQATNLPYFQGKTREWVRKKLVAAYESGDLERVTYKDRLYYRMVKREE